MGTAANNCDTPQPEPTGDSSGETSVGDPTAEFLPLVYEELRIIAASYLANERRGHTLQPTAVVHEAYLRLSEQNPEACANKEHFLAIAARSMRQVLVDHARSRHAARRGGDRLRVTLSEDSNVVDGQDVDLLALDQLIRKLEGLHARKAQVVELRFFSGLTVDQIVKVLGVSRGTINRDWRFARTWLRHEFDREDRPTPTGSPPLATPS